MGKRHKMSNLVTGTCGIERCSTHSQGLKCSHNNIDHLKSANQFYRGNKSVSAYIAKGFELLWKVKEKKKEPTWIVLLTQFSGRNSVNVLRLISTFHTSQRNQFAYCHFVERKRERKKKARAKTGFEKLIPFLFLDRVVHIRCKYIAFYCTIIYQEQKLTHKAQHAEFYPRCSTSSIIIIIIIIIIQDIYKAPTLWLKALFICPETWKKYFKKPVTSFFLTKGHTYDIDSEAFLM